MQPAVSKHARTLAGIFRSLLTLNASSAASTFFVPLKLHSLAIHLSTLPYITFLCPHKELLPQAQKLRIHAIIISKMLYKLITALMLVAAVANAEVQTDPSCHADNCLRALRRNQPKASSFCASYPRAKETEAAGTCRLIQRNLHLQKNICLSSETSVKIIWCMGKACN